MANSVKRLLFRCAYLLFGLVGLAAAAAPAAAQSGARMWQIHDPTKCIDVPAGDFRAGVQLIIYRCQNSPNQLFVLEPNGYFVANAGNPVAGGQRMCVDSDGTTVFLQPCRRLTTGDRQWWRRDGWGFIQNNHRGNTECIGLPDRSAREGSRLVIRGCWEEQVASWAPYPYTMNDTAFDEAARSIAISGGRRPNTEPTYDPERRSRWEDNVTQHGPYMVVRDSRTGFCLRVHDTLAAVIASDCGNGVQRFHFHQSSGMIREISSQNGYRGVTGLCVTAPPTEGQRLRVERCNSGSVQQRWWVINGQIQSRAAGNRCWDVNAESTQRNAYIIAWRCDTRRPGNQAFQISYESSFREDYVR